MHIYVARCLISACVTEQRTEIWINGRTDWAHLIAKSIWSRGEEMGEQFRWHLLITTWVVKLSSFNSQDTSGPTHSAIISHNQHKDSCIACIACITCVVFATSTIKTHPVQSTKLSFLTSNMMTLVSHVLHVLHLTFSTSSLKTPRA